ncbi:DNA-directed DNA polymerase II small subunit [Candidatus Woesearchaeota archaeon]|nr:DNA-directed DNA polymerase II small subunit [Candidatus Woesearchaeota archaeon]
MKQEAIQKKQVVDFFLGKDILLSSDILDNISQKHAEEIYSLITRKINLQNFLFLNNDINDALQSLSVLDLNWPDLERSKAQMEKGKESKIYPKFIKYLYTKKAKITDEKVKVVHSYDENPKKRDIQDFVRYFNMRYKAIEKLLRQRPDLKNITTINRIKNKKDRDSVSLIGMVSDKQLTKNKNLILTLEDQTGSINVLVNKNKPDTFEEARSIVLDEILGISGVNGTNIVFANKLFWPEVTARKLKKSPSEAYALFLSDLHVGSNNFLPEAFNRFLKWINGQAGNEKQKEIASKVEYIFIVGDLVDGCGIYPEQEKELDIKDIYSQYEACAGLLKQIPSRIHLIICPGNHDAMRIAEPQPPLYRDFAEPIYRLPNITSVSNPALVNIHSSEEFSGFDVLLYHGYSFDYFVANVDSIRNNGGYNRADRIMKFLLRRRHLAPTHTSTLYAPDAQQDPLVIAREPDFFITGHIHKSIAANYRNITLISGSCWQSKTSFQEKVGHNPEPGRIPLVNLKTREIKILKFI